MQEALPKMRRSRDLAVDVALRRQAASEQDAASRGAIRLGAHRRSRCKIAERLSEQRPAFAAPLNVLIQVNQGGDAHRSGARPARRCGARARDRASAAAQAARPHDVAAAERRAARTGSPSSRRCALDSSATASRSTRLSMGMSARFRGGDRRGRDAGAHRHGDLRQPRRLAVTRASLVLSSRQSIE